jgi:hypothetical protein
VVDPKVNRSNMKDCLWKHVDKEMAAATARAQEVETRYREVVTTTRRSDGSA